MTFEDIAHGLVTDGVPEVGEGSDNPVIAPGAILARHAHHQGLYFLVNGGAADRLAWLGALILLSDELVVPGEDGVRFGNSRELCQHLFAELLANPCQCFAIAVSQWHATVDLLAEEAVLSGQVLIAQPEFLVHRHGN